jgi:hypothetical protein
MYLAIHQGRLLLDMARKKSFFPQVRYFILNRGVKVFASGK